MINKTLLGLVFILMLVPSFATIENFVSVRQYRDINASTPYINEFMLCYIHNATILNWATYTGGVANITDGSELDGVYTLSCCDNCYLSGSVIVTSTYSLNYNLGSVNITTPTLASYYVGDILDSLHGVETATPKFFNLDNYVYFIPLIFIIGLGAFLWALLDSIAGFIIGATLGLFIGIFYLISIGVLSGLFLILALIVIIMVVFAWSKIKFMS